MMQKATGNASLAKKLPAATETLKERNRSLALLQSNAKRTAAMETATATTMLTMGAVTNKAEVAATASMTATTVAKVAASNAIGTTMTTTTTPAAEVAAMEVGAVVAEDSMLAVADVATNKAVVTDTTTTGATTTATLDTATTTMGIKAALIKAIISNPR